MTGRMLYQAFSLGPPASSQIVTWRLVTNYECSSLSQLLFQSFLFIYFLPSFLMYILLSCCLYVWLATAWLPAQGPSLPVLFLVLLPLRSYLFSLLTSPAYPSPAQLLASQLLIGPIMSRRQARLNRCNTSLHN